MTDSKSAGILAQMMQQSNAIVAAKRAPAAPLPPPDPMRVRVEAPFPNDFPMEALVSQYRAMKTILSDMERTLDIISGHLKAEPAPVAAPAPASEAAVREMMTAAPQVLTRVSADGWVCPDHGDSIIKTSSKTGREFRACPVCGEIERRTVA